MKHLNLMLIIGGLLVVIYLLGYLPPAGILFDHYKTVRGQFVGGICNLTLYLVATAYIFRKN
jgi:hypothetical protein